MALDRHPKVTKSAQNPSDGVSAWERWQLPNMDLDVSPKNHALTEKVVRKKSKDGTIDPADEDADALKPLTLDQIEAIRQAAYDEGFSEGEAAGKKAGYQAGFAAGESDLKATLTRLSQIMRVLQEPIPQQDEALENALLQLVEMICKRVVHFELQLNSEGLVEVIREAIDSLNPGSQRMKIHLNQIDLDMVKGKLKELGEWEEHWRVQAHPTITPGGCIIETDNSMVDARAERRLALMIQQVYGKQKHASNDKKRGQVDQLIDEVESFDFDPEDLDTNLDIENLDGIKPKS